MPAYDFVTVDVFTDQRFGGNPLAVFPEARGLTDEQMQALAMEFNLSETTFVLPPDNPQHHAKVRIFTPRAELPFAGHPNVGTGYVLAQRDDNPPEHYVFEELAGLVRVHVLRRAMRSSARAFRRRGRCRSTSAFRATLSQPVPAWRRTTLPPLRIHRWLPRWEHRLSSRKLPAWKHCRAPSRYRRVPRGRRAVSGYCDAVLAASLCATRWRCDPACRTHVRPSRWRSGGSGHRQCQRRTGGAADVAGAGRERRSFLRDFAGRRDGPSESDHRLGTQDGGGAGAGDGGGKLRAGVARDRRTITSDPCRAGFAKTDGQLPVGRDDFVRPHRVELRDGPKGNPAIAPGSRFYDLRRDLVPASSSPPETSPNAAGELLVGVAQR